MQQAQAEPVRLPRADIQAPQGLELRHLRYFVAVAEAGTFTRAAERLFIAQPTLSQQIGRLEQIVGTPLLVRGRDGVRLTAAGAVLLDAARDVLAAVDHGVSRTRQAAGLGRQRLRVVMTRTLPEALTVKTATLLRSATTAADVDLVWMETPLDAEFSLIRQHHADAGLGWLTAAPHELPAPLEAMTLDEFEPDLWIPASHPAASRGTISLTEMASLQVIYGPRRASPGTYDRWLDVLRTTDPHFAFTDPPFRHSLPVVLAFAATADPPAAVLTGRTAIAETSPGVIRWLRPAAAGDMVRVSIADRPLTATAALVWSGDLPRPLQQILFDTADGVTPPPASSPAAFARPGQQHAAELISGGTPARAGSRN
jgi:DNA-binding transcriptional LysR family regulator